MNKKINFEDDIFILMMRIRMIQDSITLDADPELFMKQTLDDISFINQTFRVLLNDIQQNKYLIEREELLGQLCGAEVQFSRVLKLILNHEGNFSVRDIPGIAEKVTTLRRYSLERQKFTGNLIPAEEDEDSVYTSSNEIDMLLKAY